MLKKFGEWFMAVVFVHGWWKKHPSEWTEIVKTKDKLTQKLIHYEMLPDMYARRGIPIHKIQCKVCKEDWYTTYQKNVCNKLGCWVAYNKAK